MSYIHYKFITSQTFEKLTFDGVSMSLAQFKKLIMDKHRLNNIKNIDFDLEVTNVDTNQVCKDESESIMKNSRILLKRVLKHNTKAQPSKIPGHSKVIHPLSQSAPAPKSEDSTGSATPKEKSPEKTLPEPSAVNRTSPPPAAAPMLISGMSKAVYDSLAPLNPTPTPPPPPAAAVVQVKVPVEGAAREEERQRLETLLQSNSMDTTTASKPMPTTNRYGVGNNGVKMQYQRGIPMNPNYVCKYCHKPGHLNKYCPDVAAGIIKKPEDIKRPSGIPVSFLKPVDSSEHHKFAMHGPNGQLVVSIMELEAAKEVKVDKAIFLTEEEEAEKERQQAEAESEATQRAKFPPELTCPLGGRDHLIEDAVLLPCCGHFVCCERCIRERLAKMEDEDEELALECPNKECDHVITTWDAITPYHQTRKLVAEWKAKQQQKRPQPTLFDMLYDDNNNNMVADAKSKAELVKSTTASSGSEPSSSPDNSNKSPNNVDAEAAAPINNTNNAPLPKQYFPPGFQQTPLQQPPFNPNMPNMAYAAPMLPGHMQQQPPFFNNQQQLPPQYYFQQQQQQPPPFSMYMPFSQYGQPPLQPNNNNFYQRPPLQPHQPQQQQQPQSNGVMSKEEFYRLQERMRRQEHQSKKPSSASSSSRSRSNSVDSRSGSSKRQVEASSSSSSSRHKKSRSDRERSKSKSKAREETSSKSSSSRGSHRHHHHSSSSKSKRRSSSKERRSHSKSKARDEKVTILENGDATNIKLSA